MMNLMMNHLQFPMNKHQLPKNIHQFPKNHTSFLRKDVDNSTKYTVEQMKIDKSPRKIAKYINEVHDIKKDVANLKNTKPSGSPTNDSFAEKFARATLLERGLDNLRYMFETITSNDQKSMAEQTALFSTYGWKLSNTVFRLQPYLSPEEKEKLDNACSFLKNDKS